MVFLVLILSSCTKQTGSEDVDARYEKASLLLKQKKYQAAIEAFNSALAIDTLNGYNSRNLKALCRKGGIESLTGEYYEALRTYRVIDEHSGNILPDSVLAGIVVDRARLLGELGEFGKAAQSLASLRKPTPEQRLALAGLYLKGRDYLHASDIYREFAVPGEDPAFRIMALSGLMNCAVAEPSLGLDTPDGYAGKIAAVSGKVMTMDAPPEKRIHALRTSAKSLLQLEKQRRNASFLFFRALALAEESGNARLVQLLQFESNAVIVQKPEVFRGAIDYFGQNNMPFAQVSALFMLGRNTEITDRERIDALRQGLSICQYYGVPATSEEGVRQEKAAVNQLIDLLIKNAMFFELFEASEQAKMLVLQRDMQRNIGSFRLPPGNEKLQHDVIEQSRELTGLFQRKINIVTDGRGFGMTVPADEAINLKRGALLDLLAEVEKIDRVAASRFQMTQVTLTTVQKSLEPGQALVNLFIRDSLTTAMLISKREMEIVSTPVLSAQVDAEVARLRHSLSTIRPSVVESLVSNANRVWLNRVLFQNMQDRLARYEHLIFVTDKPLPFHVLGDDRFLGREKKLSVLCSAREAVFYAGCPVNHEKNPGIVFFDASGITDARTYKMLHPGDEVFLVWKHMTGDQIDELKILLELHFQRERSGAGFLNALAAGAVDPGDGKWLYLTSYGID
jgi:tetratricopeptide (TPR) repeat protein